MEPFIIEEALVELLFIAFCGVAVYYAFKYLVKAYGWYVSRPPEVEDPGLKLKRAIAEGEEKLETLDAKIQDLEMKHTRFEAEVAAAEREFSKWKHLEEQAVGPDDIRKAVRKRMEAESRWQAVLNAHLESRKAIDDVEDKCEDLRHKLQLARNAQATLEARIEAAKIRQDLADDFGHKNPDVAINELEDATIESESKAEAYEETSRFHRNAQVRRVSEDDVSEEIKKKSTRKKEQSNG